MSAVHSSLAFSTLPQIGHTELLMLDPSEIEVRMLLRTLRRPFLLEGNPLALKLQQALETDDAADAVQAAIQQAFVRSPAFGKTYREIIQRCDLEAEPTKQAAAAMNLSVRTFFRLRREALISLAQTIHRLIRRTDRPAALERTCSNAPSDASLRTSL